MKIKKNILTLIVALFMLMPLSILPTLAEDTPGQRYNTIITSVDADRTVIGKPGDIVDFNVTVSFQRPNALGARDTRETISLFADPGENNNFYLIKGSDEVTSTGYYDGYSYNKYGSYDGSDSYRATFSIQIANDAKPGTYPINTKISLNGVDQRTVTTYLRIEYDPTSKARVNLSNITIIPQKESFSPGEEVIAGFSVKNPSDVPVYNVDLILTGMSPDGFTLTKNFNTKTIETLMPGEERRFTFSLKAGEKAKEGNYEFKVTLNYPTAQDLEKSQKVEKSFFLTLKGVSDKTSSVVIENLVNPTKTLTPGHSAKISFDVVNKGNDEAKRIVVKASVEGSGLVSKSVTQYFIEKLLPGEKKNYSLEFLATPASITQNYPVNIKLEYFDNTLQGENSAKITEQFTGIFVSNPEKDSEAEGKDKKKSTPKLIISKYVFEPKLPEAGKEFSMKLEFRNTADKPVKNIKISLTSPESTGKEGVPPTNIFTPVDSSNTFFIKNIPPNGKVEKEIRLYTVPDATAKTYNVICAFEYEDTENNELKASEEVGIPVVQTSKLEVGEIQYQQSFNVGEGTPVSVVFYNTGKVTLYNMMVRFVGDGLDVQNGTYYVGKFLEGSTENYDVMVNAFEPGEKEGTIIFSYEDSTGKKQEVKKDLKFQVNEAPPMDPNMNGEMPMEPQNQSFKDKFMNLLKKWYFWVGLVAIIAAITIIVKRIKRKKEEKDLTLDV